MPVGVAGLIEVLSHGYTMGTDPDEAGKVVAIELLALVIGLISLVSFIRTFLALRRTR